MFEEQVAPELSAAAGSHKLLTGSVHAFGMGEAPAAERLGELTARDRQPPTAHSNLTIELPVSRRAKTVKLLM